MRFNDAVIGGVLLALAIAVLVHVQNFPAFPGQDYGPALFPALIAVGLALASLVLIARGLRARPHAAWVSPAPWTRVPRQAGAFVLVIAALLFYILFSDALGFLITSFLILAVLSLWLGARPWIALPAAVAVTILIDWFFGSVMRVPLPRGLLALLG